MSKRTQLTTREYIISADLPEATDSYTVIPHGEVIARTKEILAQKGLEIEKEYYRCNHNAQVAQGMYHLKSNVDPEIGLLFAWNNSYDKSLRFRCCVGAYVHESLSAMVSGNISSWGRKHTGTANEEAISTIEEQLKKANDYFKKLIEDKEIMKSVKIDKHISSSFLGRCYFEHQLLTTEQMSIIKEKLKCNTDESLWGLYSIIIFALQKAHPRTWLDQQSMIHHLTMKELSCAQIDIVEANSAQLSLLEEMDKNHQSEESVTLDNTPEQDLSWPCLSCNNIQEATAAFYDGQLCQKCHELKTNPYVEI